MGREYRQEIRPLYQSGEERTTRIFNHIIPIVFYVIGGKFVFRDV